jgi:small subunit ribosomal protein S16
MLVIRLQRTGRENLPTYRLVVAEKARPVKGKFLEILGHYLPAQKDPVFKVEAEKIQEWVKKGAIPSDTVARLLRKNGLKDMDKFIKRYPKRRSKNAPPEEVAPKPAPAAPVAETPAPEAAPEAPAAEAPAA